MAHKVLTNQFLTINAVDLSVHVKSCTLTYEAEQVDDSCMGGTGTRAFLGGLKNWSIEVEFANDWAAAQVDATLFGILGTVVAVEVRPDAGARSATNPGYTGNGLVARYSPMTGGAVGTEALATVSIVPAGALSRQTA